MTCVGSEKPGRDLGGAWKGAKAKSRKHACLRLLSFRSLVRGSKHRENGRLGTTAVRLGPQPALPNHPPCARFTARWMRGACRWTMPTLPSGQRLPRPQRCAAPPALRPAPRRRHLTRPLTIAPALPNSHHTLAGAPLRRRLRVEAQRAVYRPAPAVRRVRHILGAPQARRGAHRHGCGGAGRNSEGSRGGVGCRRDPGRTAAGDAQAAQGSVPVAAAPA